MLKPKPRPKTKSKTKTSDTTDIDDHELTYRSLFENFEYNESFGNCLESSGLSYKMESLSLLLRVKKVWKVVANWCWKVLNLVDLDGCHVWN